MAAPTVKSTKETTNYARLCRLLVDVGSQALRDVFDNCHPPANLHKSLLSHHSTLKSLKTKRVLNATQWSKLYPAVPSTVSSKSFDITLLNVLLRNISGLSPPVSTRSWDKVPPATDLTREADIVRVKCFRNTVYGHAERASVDDVTFKSLWKDIRDALVRLGGPSYGSAINDLETECMDPDIEEHYKEVLKQWKKDEDNIKDKIEGLEQKFDETAGESFLLRPFTNFDQTSDWRLMLISI